MPVYEFYCSACNTVFSFFSRSVNTANRPLCPKCRADSLTRQISLVTTMIGSKTASDGAGDPDMRLPVDESRLEQAAQVLAAEAEKAGDSEDPRKAAELIQKFSKIAGLKLKEPFQDALCRMEAGEDPEQIQQSLGDGSDDEMPFELPGGGQGKTSGSEPALRRHDPKLYEM